MNYIQVEVLWFDTRDGYGVAVDSMGNEYYLSSDCCPKDLKHGDAIKGIVRHYDGNCTGLIDVERI